ncbi:MAG: hypothetical protein ACO3C1_07755 [Ilumatobacteraceae bacterium]
MILTRRLRALLTTTVAAASVLGLATTDLAFATASFTNTSVSCSVTANQPALSSTGVTLTGSASVRCTANASTTITITVQVVEMNGSTVNTMNNAFFLSVSKSISKGQTITWGTDVLTTPAKNCVNTDGTGYEDYSTIATIVQGKSSAKETVGKVDGWQCRA